MAFEDREWRREEIRQQRNSAKYRASQSKPKHTGMSLDEFLAQERKKLGITSTNQVKPSSSKSKVWLYLLIYAVVFAAGFAFYYYFQS